MRRYMSMLTICSIIILILTGCGKSAEEKYAEKMMNKNLEAAGLEGKVKIGNDGNSISISGKDGNVNIGEGQKWPDYVPENIPEFKDGEVVAAVQMGDNISVTMNYDSEKQFEDYQKEYEKAGWNKTFFYKDDESGDVMVTYDNGEYSVGLMGDRTQVTINIGKSMD